MKTRILLTLSFIGMSLVGIAQTTHSATATAGTWYRIATDAGNRANASFIVRDRISGGGHSTLEFKVGTSYGFNAGLSFTLINHSYFSTFTFTKVRVLVNSTYDPKYLEVYVNRSGYVDYLIKDNDPSSRWDPVDWLAGSIPAGYTSTEFEVNKQFVVGNAGNDFTIDHAGDVGIGTTSPSNLLHVQLESSGNTYGKGIQINRGSGYLNFTNGTGTDFFGPYIAAKASTNWATPGLSIKGIPFSDASGYEGIRLVAGEATLASADVLIVRNYTHELFTIDADGNTNMQGISGAPIQVSIDGTITSEEVIVEVVGAPDYVFAPDYQLRSLRETEEYIKANSHLPELPSAKEMEANGVELGEMNMLLLKKIEELTLHQIEQNKKMHTMQNEINSLKKINKVNPQ